MNPLNKDMPDASLPGGKRAYKKERRRRIRNGDWIFQVKNPKLCGYRRTKNPCCVECREYNNGYSNAVKPGHRKRVKVDASDAWERGYANGKKARARHDYEDLYEDDPFMAELLPA